jgi:surface protein
MKNHTYLWWRAEALAIVTILTILLAVPVTAFFIHNNNQGQQAGATKPVTPVFVSHDPSTFLSVWNTSAPFGLGDRITLPLISTGTYDFIVAWGDGNSSHITSWIQNEITHVYTVPGVYYVSITGTCKGWCFGYLGDRLKIIEISQWGSLGLGNSPGHFDGCQNLRVTATDAPDLTGTTTLYGTFMHCESIGSAGNMSRWDVSTVTDMAYMFKGAYSFNQDISTWNVSRVTNMKWMFYMAFAFNQPLGAWNVSRVTTMEGMFWFGTSFNQPIGSWDVSRVTTIYAMFLRGTSFNQAIGGWNVSSVTDMSHAFSDAFAFNQPLGAWNVSRVTSMASMLFGASSFNQPLGGWNVSRVTNMQFLFCAASSFNQSLVAWNMSGVVDTSRMFYGARSFNQPVSSWNMSGVTNMLYMFCNASSFDQDVSAWNVSRVTNMQFMFSGATSFDQHVTRYSDLLIAWSQLPLSYGVTFDAGSAKYSSTAAGARASIISTFGWTITDGGIDASISHVESIGYNLGHTGNTISWTIIDPTFDTTSYTIFRNGTAIDNGSWMNGSIITVNVDGLGPGSYNVTIVANDGQGGILTDTTIVHVYELPAAPGMATLEIIASVLAGITIAGAMLRYRRCETQSSA